MTTCYPAHEVSDSDHQLLQAWSAGDPAAGRSLARRHYDAVFLFFHARLDPEASADLTQSTFEALFSRRSEFRGDSSVRTFLFGIARWKLLDHLRRPSAREDLHAFDEEFVHAGSDRSLGSMLDARRRESLLVKAMRSLPLDDQLLLELKDYEGLTAREMAQIFSVPPGTIATRIRKARARLGEAVRERASSPEQASATVTDLDAHMRRVREQMRERMSARAEPKPTGC